MASRQCTQEKYNDTEDELVSCERKQHPQRQRFGDATEKLHRQQRVRASLELTPET